MNSEDEYKTHIPLISISHSQTECNTQTKHTIKNHNFFDLVKISNDYIIDHNKTYYLFLIKCDIGSDFSVHIETHFYLITMLINLK